MGTPSDDPRWLLGEGVFVFSRDGVAFVMHDCHGTFETQEVEKLDEVCGACRAPLWSALEAVTCLLPGKAPKKVVAPGKRKPRLSA